MFFQHSAQMSNFLITFCPNSNVASGKPIIHTQQCLLALLEKWKRDADSNQMFGALLTDLCKVFCCLNHEQLIAKLKAYEFSIGSLKLVHYKLSNRKQRTKVNRTYSS